MTQRYKIYLILDKTESSTYGYVMTPDTREEAERFAKDLEDLNHEVSVIELDSLSMNNYWVEAFQDR